MTGKHGGRNRKLVNHTFVHKQEAERKSRKQNKAVSPLIHQSFPGRETSRVLCRAMQSYRPDLSQGQADTTSPFRKTLAGYG